MNWAICFSGCFLLAAHQRDRYFFLRRRCCNGDKKLIRRHPHVFSTGAIESFGESVNLSRDQVVTNWEKIKGQEREIKRAKQQATDSDVGQTESLSILDEVPRALPALERARKLQKKAARAGFDWTEIAPVIAKLREELDEFEQALSEGDMTCGKRTGRCVFRRLILPVISGAGDSAATS